MFYSPKNNAFYPSEFKDDYVFAGSWPEDGIEVENSVFIKFSSGPPTGKVRIAGEDNLPSWGDIPAPTNHQLITQAKAKQEDLISSAKQVISIWQSELLMSEISDNDRASLKLWIAYIKALQALDLSTPDNIGWPSEPANS